MAGVGSLGLGSYPEHICEGLSSLVANFIVSKAELFDGVGVFLSEIEKTRLAGG